MMLCRKLDNLSVLILIAVCTAASNTVIADPVHSSRDHGYSSNYWSNNNWSSNKSFSNNRGNRSYNSNNSRFDRNNFSRNFPNRYRNFADTARNRSFNSNYYTNYRYPINRYRGRSRNDGFSLNLNFGNYPYRSGYDFYTNTFLNSSWNYYSPIGTHTRVIYSQPSVIYVNDSRPQSVRVIKNTVYNATTAVSTGRSLLKDLHGNCFERSYDNHGRETRVQLPDTACNF